MTYECTKNLYMKGGKKVFSKGNKYYAARNLTITDEDTILTLINDDYDNHGITKQWAKHFKEVK